MEESSEQDRDPRATRDLGRAAGAYLSAASCLAEASVLMWLSADALDEGDLVSDLDVEALLGEAAGVLERAATAHERVVELITSPSLADLYPNQKHLEAIRLGVRYLNGQAAQLRALAAGELDDPDEPKTEDDAYEVARSGGWDHEWDDVILSNGETYVGEDISEMDGEREDALLLRRMAGTFRERAQELTREALSILTIVKHSDA